MTKNLLKPLRILRIRAERLKRRPARIRKFGTFGGVFTPDVLTILGVIMFLRLGWVVGNAGFLGAVIIILLAKAVTICTGLSMSSITTNIRIGAGGAYSIISKSLGLEAGGSIGIPLYIAQTLSTALYIIGFTEGWLRIFPDHTPVLVSSIAWLGILTVSYISAHFAIRVQYLIMTILGLSLVSFFMTPADPAARFVLTNVLFLTLGTSKDKDEIINELVTQAARHELGTVILRQHPRMAFGMQRTINIWLRDKSPNWHLAMLITLQIQLNWEGRINLVTASSDKTDEKRLYHFLDRMSDQARLPSMTDFHVLIGDFESTVQCAPHADVNIFGLGEKIPFEFLRNATEWTKSSCLFVRDSGRESALV